MERETLLLELTPAQAVGFQPEKLGFGLTVFFPRFFSFLAVI